MNGTPSELESVPLWAGVGEAPTGHRAGPLQSCRPNQFGASKESRIIGKLGWHRGLTPSLEAGFSFLAESEFQSNGPRA